VIQPPSPSRLPLAALLLLVVAAVYGVVAQARRQAHGDVPAAAGAISGAPAAAALLWNGRLDLNRAGAEDLAALPGIGPVRAARIVAARAARGGRFASVDDLLDVPGIGAVTLARLRPHVRVDEARP
jgi:competence ComEA-like helix-hairpin-helix protein